MGTGGTQVGTGDTGGHTGRDTGEHRGTQVGTGGHRSTGDTGGYRGDRGGHRGHTSGSVCPGPENPGIWSCSRDDKLPAGAECLLRGVCSECSNSRARQHVNQGRWEWPLQSPPPTGPGPQRTLTETCTPGRAGAAGVQWARVPSRLQAQAPLRIPGRGQGWAGRACQTSAQGI